MSETDRNIEEAVAGLDEGKRETLKRLARGGAFVGPIVAAFAMQGIAIKPAHASNSTFNISDIRLKCDVVHVGTHQSGCGLYQFKYIWGDETYVGAIAQDVLEHVPDAVVTGPGGFLAVNYAAIGMSMDRIDAPVS
jgi:hypothetical protein